MLSITSVPDLPVGQAVNFAADKAELPSFHFRIRDRVGTNVIRLLRVGAHIDGDYNWTREMSSDS